MSEVVLRLMKMEIQHIKTYGEHQNQCKREADSNKCLLKEKRKNLNLTLQQDTKKEKKKKNKLSPQKKENRIKADRNEIETRKIVKKNKPMCFFLKYEQY